MARAVALEIELDPIEGPSQREIDRALNRALAIWLAYYRRRVDNRFKAGGPGWAPRKASTDAIATARAHKVKNLSEHKLRRKLERDLRRAKQRLDRGKGSEASVWRRAAVLRAFDVSSGKEDATKRAKFDRRLEKSVAGLKDRAARAAADIDAQILGKIAQSVSGKAKSLEAEVKSKIPWSGVHNEGGVAGHGAVEPERPFLYVDAEDAEVLAEIVNNQLGALYGAE